MTRLVSRAPHGGVCSLKGETQEVNSSQIRGFVQECGLFWRQWESVGIYFEYRKYLIIFKILER